MTGDWGWRVSCPEEGGVRKVLYLNKNISVLLAMLKTSSPVRGCISHTCIGHHELVRNFFDLGFQIPTYLESLV